MSVRVGVIDYGMGNLHSVAKAISLQGGAVVVSDDVRTLEKSDLLVLPGVGSFGAAAATLSKKGLSPFIRRWIEKDRPYLGICLGYQLLFERSAEDPGIPGLGVFKGPVTRFSSRRLSAQGLKIPHMGWNTLARVGTLGRRYFRGIPPSASFYFVHTYYPVPRDPLLAVARTKHGIEFSSAVARGRLFACQFHPEKSGERGLALLKNIIQEARAA